MSIELLAMLIGTGGFGSALTIIVNLWLGSRRATNDDARVGLDALVRGIEAANSQIMHLTDQANQVTEQLHQIELQAHRALSENNRFRIMHGETPVLSLASYLPLPDDAWEKLVERFRR